MGYIKDVKIGNDTHLIEPILYGVCSTAAATAAKEVAISNFELVNGVRIAVYFNNKNTASNPTLNVNGTGAKSIYYSSNREDAATTAISSTIPILYGWRYFIYSSGWILEEDGLSLSKYSNDRAYGNIDFRSSTDPNSYITIQNSGKLKFNYANDTYATLSMSGYNDTTSSYTPKITFDKQALLRNIATPADDTDAANKKYVDDQIAVATASSNDTIFLTVTISTSDWTQVFLPDNNYYYEYFLSNTNITADYKAFVDMGSSYYNLNSNLTITTATNSIEFETSVRPTSTITLDIVFIKTT